MTAAKLVILRHGQTDYNAQNLMTGQRDIPLNKLGEAQAVEAGALIRDIRFDKVYSSTLSRAFNTAAIALKKAGQDLPIEQRKEIIELDNGDYTGRNRVTDPEVANAPIIYDVRWPNGECLKDVVERVQKFFDADVMPRLERGENVLIVAHSVVLQAFEIVIGAAQIPPVEKLSEKKKRIPNASPLVCEYEDGVLKKHYFIANPATPRAANQNAPTAQNKNKHHPEL